VFAVFQSFEQKCTSSRQSQFVTNSRMMIAKPASAPAQPRYLTDRHSVNEEKPRCDICNRVFNSNSQALAHFHGKSHNEEVVRRANCAFVLHNSEYRSNFVSDVDGSLFVCSVTSDCYSKMFWKQSTQSCNYADYIYVMQLTIMNITLLAEKKQW